MPDAHAIPATDDLTDRVLRHTVESRPLLCPGIRLRLATPEVPLWRASEEQAASWGIVDPFWAFCWAGGHALARFLLDHPNRVAGKRVLDFGAGCGVQAIAAAQCHARVLASDVDPMALASLHLNATLNGVHVETNSRDLVGHASNDWDVVIAGDMTYEREMTARVRRWLEALSARGVLVLLADPGRGFLDTRGLDALACYDVPGDDDADGSRLIPTTVYTIAR